MRHVYSHSDIFTQPVAFRGGKWSQTGLVCNVNHGSLYMQQFGALPLAYIYSVITETNFKLHSSQSVRYAERCTCNKQCTRQAYRRCHVVFACMCVPVCICVANAEEACG